VHAARIAADALPCIVPHLLSATGLSALAHVPLPRYSQPPPFVPNELSALHQLNTRARDHAETRSRL
jgi:hypothetical protein